MQKFILAAVLLLPLGLHPKTEAQTLAGLRIGDDAARLTSLGAPSATNKYRSYLVRKWTLANGNDLSVTTDTNDRIVYVESDWTGDDAATSCDLEGLKFGTTSLADIRKRLGSNGFTFQRRNGVIQVPDGTVTMTSFLVDDSIVTFITKVPIDGDQAESRAGSGASPADRAKLDAISIAAPKYAESEWGDRINDPRYKPPEWK